MSTKICESVDIPFDLDRHPKVVRFSKLKEQLKLDVQKEQVFKQLLVLGYLDAMLEKPQFSFSELQALIDKLVVVDTFYKELGGLIGYQKKVEELLKKDENLSCRSYHAPNFIDISKENTTVDATSWGIDALPYIAEMYPLGGAADRLHLVDEKTQKELPAAKLVFAKKTLFERLIRDLQAREFLYFQIHGKQIVTPIAVMTSLEKDNHLHVQEMAIENCWFGRPKSSFFFFIQPLVPVVNEKGEWLFSSDFKPILKPGGHGALWKIAKDSGGFSWLKSQGIKNVLVRQINNPMAALDYGLLAFMGIGAQNKMKFGFASCPRLVHSAEGVNVVIEENSTIVLTNIEYCDFAKFGIQDVRLKEDEPYSCFSSNTNLLFGCLDALEEAVEKCPFPGLLMNLKKGFFLNSEGISQESLMGRLESTMQNIADVFVEKKNPLNQLQHTFITYNKRHKTISTAKRAFVEGGTLQETPEACFYDLLFAARELLMDCKVSLPDHRFMEEYLKKGPEFVFLYHPALGPLYSIIRQKIQGGQLASGSELICEIADLSMVNLDLSGSLEILAHQVMGHVNEEGLLCYSNKRGKCSLKNVKIVNEGVDWKKSHPFWKANFFRKECVEIVLEGHSEFVAEDVVLRGSHLFEVKDGHRLYVRSQSGKLILEETFI